MPKYYVEATSCDHIEFMREFDATSPSDAERQFEEGWPDARIDRVMSEQGRREEQRERELRLQRQYDDGDYYD